MSSSSPLTSRSALLIGAIVGLAFLVASACGGDSSTGPATTGGPPPLVADVEAFLATLAPMGRTCSEQAYPGDGLSEALQKAVDGHVAKDLDTVEWQRLAQCGQGRWLTALTRSIQGSFPEAAAPFGLGQVDWKDTDFNDLDRSRLPSEIDGLLQDAGPDVTEGRIATYGSRQEISMGVSDANGSGMLVDGATAPDGIATFALGADWDVHDFGQEDGLYWVRWSTFAGEAGDPNIRELHVLMWGETEGETEGESVVNAVADSPGRLEAAVGAFIEFVGSR